jgi:sugar lactone lactonase YvrE
MARKNDILAQQCGIMWQRSMIFIAALIIAGSGFTKAHLWAQKVQIVNGVRLIHNSKGGKWGKNPKIALELIQTLGGVEAKDQNFAFYLPSDIAVDGDGNLYILDSGNHRVQKFSLGGEFIATLGRKGQGPAEFYFPLALEIDGQGYLYVSDPNNNRIVVMTPEGKDYKVIKPAAGPVSDIATLSTGNLAMGGRTWFTRFGSEEGKVKELPKLIKILNLEGNALSEVGFQNDFGNFLLNKYGNSVNFSVDSKDDIFLAFMFQNRLEKYSPDGRLLWRADRELNYSTEPIDKGSTERGERGASIKLPKMNTCSNGVAVDGQGRVWVVTLERQLKNEEQAGIGITVNYMGDQRLMSYKVEAEAEVYNTDAYKLEIYDPDGVLLGEIAVDHFVDGIFIYGDRLFFLDKMRGMKFYAYRILER